MSIPARALRNSLVRSSRLSLSTPTSSTASQTLRRIPIPRQYSTFAEDTSKGDSTTSNSSPTSHIEVQRLASLISKHHIASRNIVQKHTESTSSTDKLVLVPSMNHYNTMPTRPNPGAPWAMRNQQPAHNGPNMRFIPQSASPTARPSNKEKRCERTPPSAASGGIPDPTLTYLQLAAYPPMTLPEPRKLLVVIDLNGTLLHRPNKHHPTRFVERPHAKQFLAYCIEVFDVVIWSSAKPANVASMCNQLLTPEQRKRVITIWARDKFGLTPADFTARTQCYKRLHVLWNDPAVVASHPEAHRGVRWSQQDTVLIDDSIEKARSEPHNLIEIPEFTSENPEVADILPQVHDYINECASQANVSSFVREKPFKAMPISQLPR